MLLNAAQFTACSDLRQQVDARVPLGKIEDAEEFFSRA